MLGGCIWTQMGWDLACWQRRWPFWWVQIWQVRMGSGRRVGNRHPKSTPSCDCVLWARKCGNSTYTYVHSAATYYFLIFIIVLLIGGWRIGENILVGFQSLLQGHLIVKKEKLHWQTACTVIQELTVSSFISATCFVSCTYKGYKLTGHMAINVCITGMHKILCTSCCSAIGRP